MNARSTKNSLIYEPQSRQAGSLKVRGVQEVNAASYSCAAWRREFRVQGWLIVDSWFWEGYKLGLKVPFHALSLSLSYEPQTFRDV